MKSLDFEHNLFISVVALDFPAFEIESNNFLSRKLLRIVEVGQEDGNNSIGTDHSDDPEFNGFHLLSVFSGYFIQEVAGWVNKDLVFVFPTLNECFYSGERGLCGTSEYVAPFEFFVMMTDKFIAWEATIIEYDTVGRDKWQ
jgi:hypothetical protein